MAGCGCCADCQCDHSMDEARARAAVAERRAEMSTADQNDLPDSAFAYIEPGGSKDAEGKTTPRSLRHFPIHDAAHVRNALARAPQSPFGDKAMPAIKAAAKKFGIEVSEEDSAGRVPFELRKQRRSSMLAIPERLSLSFALGGLEMRARPNGTGGTSFRFEGYAATFDQPFEMWDPWGDPYTEVVRPGAFTRTLANGADVAFLIGHQDAGILLARTKSGTMHLAQDSRGLHVDVPAMDGGREDVRALASAVERGDMDEMSCAFVTRQQEWSPDYEQRSMLEMDLNRGDVSAVVFGANPGTAGSSMLPSETLSLRRPVAVRAAMLHPPLSGAHSHPHSAYGDQGGDESHAHMHVHNNDANHAHDHSAMRAAGTPLEQRDGGGQPDDDTPDYDPQANGMAMVACPYTQSNGCGAMNPGGNRFCGSCGGSLYSQDGTLILDDEGVPSEVSGDPAMSYDAARAALELRQRKLALLTVAR